MATRFYFPSTGTPGISPAFGSWDVTSNADRREMVRTRISSAMTNKDGSGDATVGNHLLRQYVSSESLAAQTLSGTIKGQVRIQNVGGGNVGSLAVRVAKCASDGSGVTEILIISYSTDASGVPPRPDTTMTNRRFEQGDNDFALDLTSTAIDAGDRLIVELGYRDTSTNTSRYCRHSLGDDSATDLAEDETTTTADNPWIEFSADIAFAAAGGSGGDRNQALMLRGVG